MIELRYYSPYENLPGALQMRTQYLYMEFDNGGIPCREYRWTEWEYIKTVIGAPEDKP